MGEKSLRVGLVLDGTLVEERLLRRPGTVTLGQSPRCTLAVALPELPRSFPLFRFAGGRLVLHVTRGMDARLVFGDKLRTLAELRAAGALAREGAVERLPLPEGTRGKVTVGDLTVLFQTVAAPPAPRPQLPRGLRLRLRDRVDPWMAAIVALSLVGHGAAAAYVRGMEAAAPPTADEVPSRFAREVLRAPIPAPPVEPMAPVAPPPDAPEDPVGAAPESTAARAPRDGGGHAPAPTDAASVAGRSPLLSVLARRSEDGTGRFVDVTRGRDYGDALDRDLDRAAQAGAGTVDLPDAPRSPLEAPEIGAGDVPAFTAPHPVEPATRPKVDEEIRLDVDTGPVDPIDDGGLDPDEVIAILKARYFKDIKRCYERVAKVTPGLSGKVLVSFEIGAAGKVIRATSDGPDPRVDRCIESSARAWRFGRPSAGTAAFEASFLLRPGT